jgi:hypothetical protein
MEIKEGMYVRTNTGIRRVVYINDGCITFDDFMSNGTSLFNFIEEKELDMYLTKEPSYRITALIEVGDYLNGIRVNQIERNSSDNGTIIKIGNSTFNVLDNEEIYVSCYEQGYEKIEKLKSIVTKEQFANMEYKVVG